MLLGKEMMDYGITYYVYHDHYKYCVIHLCICIYKTVTYPPFGDQTHSNPVLTCDKQKSMINSYADWLTITNSGDKYNIWEQNIKHWLTITNSGDKYNICMRAKYKTLTYNNQ